MAVPPFPASGCLCLVCPVRASDDPARNLDGTNGDVMDDLFPGYETIRMATRAGAIHARVGGAGSPLLLLHGYP